MSCKEPEAFYLARDGWDLQEFLLGTSPGLCHDDKHRHRIMRLWDLARDLELKDA